MRQRQVQARTVQGQAASHQLIAHAQGLGHGHAGITPGQYIVHLTEQKFLEGLGQVLGRRQLELGFGKRLEFGGQPRLF
ncbi:hypothetical protein D3C79_760090 [compost metagenome]